MLFAARKLRLDPALRNPTVVIVVDRIDLDTQISSTFYAADTPNLVKAERRKDLGQLLSQDVRKIIITRIFTFGEAEGVLNDRDNIIVLVDEAHRTQEGDLGRKMREALPNAFLFGLTGTPINRTDRNTFYAFGSDQDEHGYMSRYGFEESIRDGATKELHFEPRLIDLHIDEAAIDEALPDLTGGLSDLDRDQLAKTAAKMSVLVKSPERVREICEDIAAHFQEKVAPNGFGAQVVTFDREACVLYKRAWTSFPPETSDIVMTVNSERGRVRRVEGGIGKPRRSCSTDSATPAIHSRFSSSHRSCSLASTRQSCRRCTSTSRCGTTRSFRRYAGRTDHTGKPRPTD